jgi:hypothetical protein
VSAHIAHGSRVQDRSGCRFPPKQPPTIRRPTLLQRAIGSTVADRRRPGARMSELCGLTWANVRLVDLTDAEVEFGWQVDPRASGAPPRRMDRPERSRYRGSWRPSSPATSWQAATRVPTPTCSQRARADRSGSETSPGRSGPRRPTPETSTSNPRSRFCTIATSAGGRCRPARDTALDAFVPSHRRQSRATRR